VVIFLFKLTKLYRGWSTCHRCW